MSTAFNDVLASTELGDSHVENDYQEAKIYMGSGAKQDGWIPLPRPICENKIVEIIENDQNGGEKNVKINTTKNVSVKGWQEVSYRTVLKEIEPLIEEHRLDKDRDETTFADDVEKAITGIDWSSTPDNDFSRHDFIQSCIVAYCTHDNVYAVPELAAYNQNSKKGSKKRIDVGIFVDGKLQSAIEVDGSVKNNSVSKLAALPTSVERIIVSKAKRKEYIQRRCEEYLPNTFEHIDAELHTVL